MRAPVLAVDFGTSNSAAAVLDGTTPRRIPIEVGTDTLPTSVFFPLDGSSMRIGTAANEALIDGGEGRYMRALKSILGTPLFHESRLIAGKRRTLAEIVTAFLATMKRRVEAETGKTFRHVLSGRPVHFHSSNPERDARAEEDLGACYHSAGFDVVHFLYEPEAAARSCSGLNQNNDIGLIVDIGGGTSDFSVFRASPNGVEILASHGIRLGGTDFDHKISMDQVMPLLGCGGQMRRAFGPGLLPVPNSIYLDLATWAKIPFIYSGDTQRRLKDLLRDAVEPAKIMRLQHVITERLGHELAFAVERGKIMSNASAAQNDIDLSIIENELAVPLTTGLLNGSLETFSGRLRDAVSQTLTYADVAPGHIKTAILVGGSSLMQIVSSAVRTVCPAAHLQRAEAFTAVVDGLALATAESW